MNYKKIKRKTQAKVFEKRTQALLKKEIGKGKQSTAKTAYPLYLSVLGLSYLGNFYSLFTLVFIACYMIVRSLTALPYTLALGIGLFSGLALGLLLEYSKRAANDNFFRCAVFEGKYPLTWLIALVLTGAISVVSSFYACTVIPQVASVPPPLVNIDSIQASYRAALAVKQGQHKTITEKGTWRGTITRNNQKTLNALQVDISNLEAERRTMLSQAKTKNKEILAKHKTETAANGNLLAWCMVGSELMFILCFFYQKKYLYDSACERNMLQDPANEITDAGINVAPSLSTADGSRPIGFQMPKKKDDNRPEISMKGEIRRCEQCGTSYAVKRKDQRFCCASCRKKWHRLNNE